MTNFNRLLLATLLCSTLLNAEENSFYEQHKINKSYIKARAKHESNRGSSNAISIEIKNKKELKEAIKSGELHKTYEEKGDKHISIKIKNVHLSKKEAEELEGVIGSTVESKGRVNQVVSLDGVTVDSDEPLIVGIETTSGEVDSITSVTTITDSQIGGD
jgi:hypothetical protein